MSPKTTNNDSCRIDLESQLRPAIFRALSDPTRIAVLCRLAASSHPLTVSEITDCCGIHISGVSRHLSQLREAGIVHGEKSGREMRYRLDAARVTQTLRGLADAIDLCQSRCCGQEEQ